MAHTEEVPHTDWTEILSGETPSARLELAQLKKSIRGHLIRIIRGKRPFCEDDIDDLLQETMLRLIESVSSFRGECRLSTWAHAIATRVALTELRRKRFQQSLDAGFDFEENGKMMFGSHSIPEPSQSLLRHDALEELKCILAKDLSERQRFAILAELQEIPSAEIAERLNINRNALYKLHHDARKKLRAALLDAGFTPQEILAAASETS